MAEHLFRDIDAARRKNDRSEEHYLRRLLWAISGNNAPPEFYCPISLDIMEEPVILFQTEVTYDRRSIETWLFSYEYKNCPVSGKPLTDFLFVENRPLRSLIEEWKRGQNFPTEVCTFYCIMEAQLWAVILISAKFLCMTVLWLLTSKRHCVYSQGIPSNLSSRDVSRHWESQPGLFVDADANMHNGNQPQLVRSEDKV